MDTRIIIHDKMPQILIHREQESIVSMDQKLMFFKENNTNDQYIK